MGSLSIWHWLIILFIVLIAFGGRGKVSEILGDFGKGIKSFKKGMQDDEGTGEPKALGEQTASGEAKSADRSKV